MVPILYCYEQQGTNNPFSTVFLSKQKEILLSNILLSFKKYCFLSVKPPRKRCKSIFVHFWTKIDKVLIWIIKIIVFNLIWWSRVIFPSLEFPSKKGLPFPFMSFYFHLKIPRFPAYDVLDTKKGGAMHKAHSSLFTYCFT